MSHMHSAARDPRPARARRASTRRCPQSSVPSGDALRLALLLLAATALPHAIHAQTVPRAASPAGIGQSAESDSAALAITRDSGDGADLRRLVTAALATNPTVRAARQRVEAARARVGPAALRPDPMLMVGLRDFPLSQPGFYDNFTMKMVGVSQAIPYPGKLGLQRRVATAEAELAQAALAVSAGQVARDVRDAYYELAFLDRALDIVGRNRDVLVSLLKVTEARYAVAAAGQQDVLRARVEASRLAEQAVTLAEDRGAALARLDAVLDRSSDAPVVHPTIPARITRAAVADSASHVRFTSAALGARAADSPLPPLAELQARALRESPLLRESDATIATQAARVELARKDYLPDVDLALEYGQRDGFTDLVTARVSLPLRLQKSRRENQLVVAAGADLAALEAERAARRNEVRAEVARLVSALERQRAQLALYKSAIIPQGRASLASALASYQVGRVEFLTVLENQATLFNYETEYFRVLSDFARALAELEQVTGTEILP